MFTIRNFAVGNRIELHPATDRWMRGDRFGTVESVGRSKVTVKMDTSGQTTRVDPRNVFRIL